MVCALDVLYLAHSVYREPLVVHHGASHSFAYARERTTVPCGRVHVANVWDADVQFPGQLIVTESTLDGKLHSGLTLDAAYHPYVDVWIPVAARPSQSYIQRSMLDWCRLLATARGTWKVHLVPLDATTLQVTRESTRQCGNFAVVHPMIRTPHGTGVRQQKIDMVKILQRAARANRLVMVAEDDFPPCTTAYAAIHAVLRPGRYREFSAVLAAVGMNGMIFAPQDVRKLAKYIHSAVDRNKQVDHLTHEWLLQETTQAKRDVRGRHPVTTRVMHFYHIGAQSSLGHMHSPRDFQCGHSMAHAHFPGLNYDVQCEPQDASPC